MSSHYTVRPAEKKDMAAVQAIFNHYVRNTALTFLINETTLDYMIASLTEITGRGLPYLVAVDNETQEVRGYAAAGPFRGHLLGYQHTVEMSLFVHHEYQRNGIGSLLVVSLLHELEKCKHTGREFSGAQLVQGKPALVRNVIAITAVDTVTGTGEALADFYVKYGFEEVGRLRRVGFKRDNWIDTIYLQCQLPPGVFDPTLESKKVSIDG